MSSKRGEGHRKRPQRYQNSFAFKNNLHDSSDRIKRLNAMSINEVCQKCCDVIEWKIKYRKYKARKAPGNCNCCNQRTVKKAYHVLCRDCAIANRQCAKCLRKDGEVDIIPAEPTDEEKLQLRIEMKVMIKSLSERKRRTFNRFMNGKKKRKNREVIEDENGVAQKVEKEPTVVRTREELLQKIETLKLADDQIFEGVLDDEEDDDESYDSGDFTSDEEDDEGDFEEEE